MSQMFTKIQNADEKTSIFEDVGKARAIFLAKPAEPGKSIFTLRGEELTPEGLRCHLVKGDPPNKSQQLLIIEFYIGGEKYFAQMKAKKILDSFYLQTEGDLFRLQRRDNFRLRFPKGFQAHFELQSINNQPSQLKLALVDLSGGGCRLENISKIQFNKNDKISGTIIMTNRDPISVSGTIRHVFQVEKKVVLGIEFTGIVETMKDRIAAQVMDLYRELFSRIQ